VIYVRTKASDDDGDTNRRTTLGSILTILVALAVNEVFNADTMIFDVLGLPFYRLPDSGFLALVWWIPVWAFAENLFYSLFLRKRGELDLLPEPSPLTVFGGVALIGSIAAVLEEISYRYLALLSGIAMIGLVNLIFCGIPELFYTMITIPLANLMTLGLMEPLLYHPEGWLVGAAILSSSAAFREGHAYQGFVGWVTSWYFSMAMFFLLFEQGLVACMIAHFLFNITVAVLVGLRQHFLS